MGKILVVDDEKDVVELVKFLLMKEGHSVLEAYDGNEGLALAKAERPELIVLDIMMPDMDGFTMNSRLLEDNRTKDIPVVVLTAKGQMRETFELAANVHFYIEKPFEPKDLIKSIQDLLKTKN
jgi:CheY-like chemotaxis protein